MIKKNFKKDCIQAKYSFPATYKLLTDKSGESGACRHIDGNDLANCFNDTFKYEYKCKSACSNHGPCIGYNYLDFHTKVCWLIISSLEETCPETFTLHSNENYTTLAETIDDLKVRKHDHFKCYAKISGKPLILIFMLLNLYGNFFVICYNSKS